MAQFQTIICLSAGSKIQVSERIRLDQQLSIFTHLNILLTSLGNMNFKRNIKLCALKAFPLRAQGGISPNMALGKMPTRPALLLRLEDTFGCFGWGEIWANFPPRANIHKAILEDVIASEICGMTYVDPREVIEMLRKKLSVYFLHIGQACIRAYFSGYRYCSVGSIVKKR